MRFNGKALAILATSLYIRLAASATEAETFLAENPEVMVGREALAQAEANLGLNTFGVVSRPASNIGMLQEFDADTKERVFAVALVDDEKAEKYYKVNNKDGDVKGQVMKRYNTTAEPDRCGQAADTVEPHMMFRRASRCGQFCSRSHSCTGNIRCPSCRYVNGRCTHQLSCQPRTL